MRVPLFCALILLFNLMDLHSTYQALRRGAREMNPLFAWLFRAVGFWWSMGVKFTVVALVMLYYCLRTPSLSEPVELLFFAVLLLPVSCVVISNYVQLWIVHCLKEHPPASPAPLCAGPPPLGADPDTRLRGTAHTGSAQGRALPRTADTAQRP